MKFIWDELSIGNLIASLILIVVIYALLVYVLLKVAKRRASFIFLGISGFIFILAFLFNLPIICVLTAAVASAGLAACFFANLGDLRKFIANPFSRPTAKAANFGIEKIFDSQQLYKNIETAVISLSNARIGAIMTFEKNTSLKEIMKNGVPVHAPVSPEILMTIFYPGTRLHDGAVVVHGNEIVAASVFFTPSTAPFAGKYGSRHRAAIGVSEVSDAITIVVSEETGRISIAANGELQMVDQSKFLMTFETYMADSADNKDYNKE